MVRPFKSNLFSSIFHGTIFFSVFFKMKFGIFFLNFDVCHFLGVKGLSQHSQYKKRLHCTPTPRMTSLERNELPSQCYAVFGSFALSPRPCESQACLVYTNKGLSKMNTIATSIRLLQ